MLHLSGTTQTPPGGWMFKIDALSERAPKLAWVGPYHTLPDLVNEVRRRATSNGIPVPTSAEIEDQICRRAPAGMCRDELGAATQQPGSLSVMASMFVQGTRTLFGWWRHGGVTQDDIVRRSYICNACPENRPIAGCSACALREAHEVINLIVANKSLPTDALLNACKICDCSLKAKVRMRVEDILPHMSSEQKRRLPDACWLLTESEATKEERQALTTPILT